MHDSYILSIDCGTQSIRAILFDKKGNLIGKVKKEFNPYFSRNPGWAEQNTDVYWNNLKEVCCDLQRKCCDKWNDIIGVSLTTQRDTSVCVDKNGNALRPAILWLDQRSVKNIKPLSTMDNIVFSAIGMKEQVEKFRRQFNANWIKENQPEIWEKTHKYLLLSGFLTYKLTDKMVDSISSQIGYIPFNYKKKAWAKPNDFKSKIFTIEREKLPKLVSAGEILGYITKKASLATGIREGLPLVAAGSDKGCETLGTGCFSEKQGSISLGSTATIQTTTSKYFETTRFLPPYPALIPNHYNPEIEIFRGYWMISWFKKEFALKETQEAKEMDIQPEKLLNQRLKEIPPGSHGLMLQPYWGAELKMPEAKGSIIGFGDVHTRIHIYRSIIEGINYALREGIEKIEKKSGVKMEKILVSGGGSQSDVICQITADMLNRPIIRVQTYETSGLGAAISGFVGLKVYDTFEIAVKKMVHDKDVFEPNGENVEIYTKLYNRVYKKMYASLRNIYKDIRKITNYPS
jgi:sugar (pentulose or hexulose) kinase